MKYLYPVIATLISLLVADLRGDRFWGFEDARKAFHGKVWEVELEQLSESEYADAVERMIAAFERERGEDLGPGEWRRAGIKVYTHSGPGLRTPPALTRAVVRALERRGFARDELFIFDTRESNLRWSGYLPPLSGRAQGDYFHGVPVRYLDGPGMRDPVWYYDSPLPEEFTTPLGRELLRPTVVIDPEELRRSFLPAPLITDVDFWINLPVAMDQRALGLSGAMVNATLWSISNNIRFFGSPVNAPVAVAEIAAIPELLDTWALSIVSLESYQFIGGPAFNANYTASEPLLWMSVDPVILDAMLLDRINRARGERGFSSLGSLLPYLDYAVNFGLGRVDLDRAKIRQVE